MALLWQALSWWFSDLPLSQSACFFFFTQLCCYADSCTLALQPSWTSLRQAHSSLSLSLFFLLLVLFATSCWTEPFPSVLLNCAYCKHIAFHIVTAALCFHRRVGAPTASLCNCFYAICATFVRSHYISCMQQTSGPAFANLLLRKNSPYIVGVRAPPVTVIGTISRQSPRQQPFVATCRLRKERFAMYKPHFTLRKPIARGSWKDRLVGKLVIRYEIKHWNKWGTGGEKALVSSPYLPFLVFDASFHEAIGRMCLPLHLNWSMEFRGVFVARFFFFLVRFEARCFLGIHSDAPYHGSQAFRAVPLPIWQLKHSDSTHFCECVVQYIFVSLL